MFFGQVLSKGRAVLEVSNNTKLLMTDWDLELHPLTLPKLQQPGPGTDTDDAASAALN